MPYAADDRISTDPFEGSVEISEEEYQLALEEMTKGNSLQMRDGMRFVPRPDTPAPAEQVRALSAEELLQFLVDEGVVPTISVKAVLDKVRPSRRTQ